MNILKRLLIRFALKWGGGLLTGCGVMTSHRWQVISGLIFGLIGLWQHLKDENLKAEINAAFASANKSNRTPAPTLARSPKDYTRLGLSLFSLVAFLCLASGCAYVRSTTTRAPQFGTNGIVSIKENTTLVSYSLFDASATIAKVSNRSAAATNNGSVYAPGTYIQGLEQGSSSSNAVVILQLISALAAKALVP